MSDYIQRVKVLLGLSDDLQDDLLREIEDNTLALYKALTGALSVPFEHEFMIREVMVKRYNRIGNEGMSQERQADLLLVFDQGDFDQYQKILDKHYSPHVGGIKFL